MGSMIRRMGGGGWEFRGVGRVLGMRKMGLRLERIIGPGWRFEIRDLKMGWGQKQDSGQAWVASRIHSVRPGA
jgi:hypothetical protein